MPILIGGGAPVLPYGPGVVAPAKPRTGQITYLAYDLMTSNLLAELPFGNVSWSQKLNDVGQFKGTLDLRDKRVQNLDPYDATRPGRTMLAIDIDGSLVWLGLMWTRRYQSSSGKVDVGGSELWSYFNNRLQAQDYSNVASAPTFGAPVAPGNGFWGSKNADPQMIAAALIADVLGLVGHAWTNAGQYGVQVSAPSGFPGTALSWMSIYVASQCLNLIAPSYPVSQRQMIGSAVSTLASAGYGLGFDFGIDPSWSSTTGSVPEAQLTLSYPRRGRVAGTTGLAIDSASCIDYEWPEDATQMMNSLVATAGGSGSTISLTTPQVTIADSAPQAAGYPLVEGTQSYSAVNTSDLLSACAGGDLAAYEWPVTTPKYILPLWDDLYVGDFIMGDDIRLIQQADDRFPTAFDKYLRIVANDVSIPDEGEPTMALTLNMPIGAAPVPAPPL